MIMLIHLHLNIQHGTELIHVRLASSRTEDALIGEGVKFRYVAGEDFIPARETGVGGDYRVVWTGDGEGGTAVEFVRGEAAFVWGLGYTVIDGSAVD